MPVTSLSPEMPCFIPAFNNPTYVRQVVQALSRFPNLKLVILDNASTYEPLLDLYSDIEAGRYGDVRVLRLGCNAGPRFIWYNASFLSSLPQFFCITDPDLEVNRDLPPDFLESLMELTETYMVGKAGFALSLAEPDLMIPSKFRHCEGWLTICEAEAKHWQVPLPALPSGDPAYYATLDTTFAVYNRKYFDVKQPFEAVRVAGRFTCRHLPWYLSNGLPDDEETYYRRATEFSYYMGDRPAVQVRRLFAYQDALASAQLDAAVPAQGRNRAASA
jgi:hypothetical protein